MNPLTTIALVALMALPALAGAALAPATADASNDEPGRFVLPPGWTPAAPEPRGSPASFTVPPGQTQLRVDAALVETAMKDVALAGHEWRVETGAAGRREYVVDGVRPGDVLTFQPFELTREGMFSRGSAGSVLLEARPMHIRLLEHVPGSDAATGALAGRVNVDFEAADDSGQAVLWNEAWLETMGVVVPWFLWDNSTTLEHTFNGTHFRVAAPHFTSIAASGIDVEYQSATSAKVTWSVTWTSSCPTYQRYTNVRYGLTTSYGATLQGTLSGSIYSATITGLADDSLYHFRLEAYCEDLNGVPYNAQTGNYVMLGVGVKLGTDDDYRTAYTDHATRVESNMETGGNYFFKSFGIDFYKAATFDHTNSYLPRAVVADTTYRDAAQTAQSWPGTDNDADLFVMYTNVDLSYWTGTKWETGVYGIAEAPFAESKSTNADAFVIEPGPNSDDSNWRRFLFQHEAGHPFDARDYTTEIAGCSVMDYTDAPSYTDCPGGATAWDSTSANYISTNRLSVADRDDVHTAV